MLLDKLPVCVPGKRESILWYSSIVLTMGALWYRCVIPVHNVVCHLNIESDRLMAGNAMSAMMN